MIQKYRTLAKRLKRELFVRGTATKKMGEKLGRGNLFASMAELIRRRSKVSPTYAWICDYSNDGAVPAAYFAGWAICMRSTENARNRDVRRFSFQFSPRRRNGAAISFLSFKDEEQRFLLGPLLTLITRGPNKPESIRIKGDLEGKSRDGEVLMGILEELPVYFRQRDEVTSSHSRRGRDERGRVIFSFFF